MTSPPSLPKVRSRQVYYISGFDRRGPLHYHALYAEQAVLQARVNHWQIDVGPAQADGPSTVSWHITTHIDGQTAVHTRYTYLRWEDLTDAYWPRSTWVALARLPAFYARYVFSGALGLLWRHAKRFLGMVLAPGVLFIAGMIVALVLVQLAWASGLGAKVLADLLGLAPGSAILANGVVAAAVGMLAWWPMWRWFHRQRLWWLGRAWHFLDRFAEGADPAIGAKWQALGDVLYERWRQSDADEQLIVAHCGGTPAAMGILAHVYERMAQADDEPIGHSGHTHVLTLAQTIPFVTFFPGAAAFRRHIKAVACGPWKWFNMASPHDPLCCGLSDPLVGVPDMAHAPQKPNTRSARFDLMVSAENYEAMRREPFRIHFQYLMASEHPVMNDYFSITAGPMSLPQRWAQFP